MSRLATTAIVGIMVLLISGMAGAYTAKWCFHWKGKYEDAGFGEDYLNINEDDGTNEIAAMYTYVKVYRVLQDIPPTWGEVWSGYLNTAGCTDLVTIEGDQTYVFLQYLKLKRSNRIIEVHPDGECWDGDTDAAYSEIETPAGLLPQLTYDAPVPPDSTNNRLMPAFVQFLANANTLDFPDGANVDVVTDSTCGGTDCTGITDQGRHHYHLCVANGHTNEKFVQIHELGHAVSHENDSFTWGEPPGSEGAFNAGDYCDCSITAPGHGHCPTSREFMGKGQLEGFSHFISAASMNTRSHVSGWFVFYKNVREASYSHYSDFPDIFECPSPQAGLCPPAGGDSNDYTPKPFPTPLSTSSNIKWTNYECDPGSSLDIYLRGNEWDWLEFFWNLYTDGSNKYDISEMNDIWHQVQFHTSNTKKIVCCDTETVCNSYQFGTHGVLTCASPLSNEIEVGLKWEDIEDYVYSVYGSGGGTKGGNFHDKGYAAGVSAY